MALSPRPWLGSVTISRREWWLAGTIALFMALWASGPTFVGYLHAPTGQEYLATNIPDVFDSQVYYGFIAENARGHALYTNLFTSEPQRATLFHPLWLGLGLLSRLTGWTAPAVSIGANIGFGIGVALLLWYLVSHFVGGGWRFITYALVLAGGGLGGLVLTTWRTGSTFIDLLVRPEALRTLPADLTHPGGFTWSTIAHAPLTTLSLGLLLVVLLVVWKGWRRRWGMMAVMLLGFIHPYDLTLVFGILGGSLLIGAWRNLLTPEDVRAYLKTIGWYFVAAGPVVAYYAWALWAEPVTRQWYTQNALLAPNIIALITGYGALLVGGITMVRRWWRTSTMTLLPIIGWTLVGFLLLYLPIIRFQAKMMATWSLPLAILTAMLCQRAWIDRRRWRPAVVLVLLMSLSTAVIFPLRMIASQRSEPRYHYAADGTIAALRWISEHGSSQDVVLADVLTGNLVPHYAGRPTYIGHNIQTIDFERKLRLTREWFFATDGDIEAKQRFLASERVSWVVWGPNERRRGALRPELLTSLQPVFQGGETTVFKHTDD